MINRVSVRLTHIARRERFAVLDRHDRKHKVIGRVEALANLIRAHRHFGDTDGLAFDFDEHEFTGADTVRIEDVALDVVTRMIVRHHLRITTEGASPS